MTVRLGAARREEVEEVISPRAKGWVLWLRWVGIFCVKLAVTGDGGEEEI